MLFQSSFKDALSKAAEVLNLQIAEQNPTRKSAFLSTGDDIPVASFECLFLPEESSELFQKALSSNRESDFKTRKVNPRAF